MVGRRFGARVSVEELRLQVVPGPEGLNLQQLQRLAAENGLPCRPARVSADRLGQVSLPVVAHLSNGHYVVIHEWGETGVVVGDPEMGIVNWSADYLGQRYSGVLLLFDLPRAPGSFG
jgi:ABC-type bacteriocin/lantibiotic exporter with double-glycine peptidase domain